MIVTVWKRPQVPKASSRRAMMGAGLAAMLALSGCGMDSGGATSDDGAQTAPTHSPTPPAWQDGEASSPPSESPTSTPGPTAEPADVTDGDSCFPDVILQPGARQMLTYQAETPDGMVDVQQDVATSGPVDYDGIAATRIDLALTISGSQGSGHLDIEQFLNVDAAASTTHLMEESTSVPTAQGDLTTREVFQPPVLEIYDLRPGDSHFQTYTTQVTGPQGSTSSQETDLLIVYEGRRSVTVPAGTFETCHFRREETVRGEFGTQMSSFEILTDIRSGVAIRSILSNSEGTQTTELLSGSVNGVSL